MISLLYNTNRYGGFDVLRNNLRKQTFKDFEVVIVDELFDERSQEVFNYMSEFPLTYIKPRSKTEDDAWNFNKAMNDGIKACRGSLVVVLQDYIWIQRDSLQKFWDIYQEMPYTFVSTIGHKHKYPDKLHHTKGLMSTFEKDYADTPSGIMEFDFRDDGKEGIVESNSSQWEMNLGSFPLSMAYRIGGFDEDADKYFGGDNVQFSYRAEKEGAVVYIDKSNKTKGMYHQYWFPRAEGWDEKHFNRQPDGLTRYDSQHILDFV